MTEAAEQIARPQPQDLSDAQLVHRLRTQMRPTKTRRARTLNAVCRDLGWSYGYVYQRLDRKGLLPSVMAAKYEGAPA